MTCRSTRPSSPPPGTSSIGVFPLRFETAGAVVGALGSLAVHGLGVEELVGYRVNIEAVDVAAVAAAARSHLHVDDASIVLVGDVDAFGPALEAAGLGTLVIERDEVSLATGPAEEDAQPGPIDDEGDTGPTAGAEEPALPGLDDTAADDGEATPGDRTAVIDPA